MYRLVRFRSCLILILAGLYIMIFVHYEITEEFNNEDSLHKWAQCRKWNFRHRAHRSYRFSLHMHLKLFKSREFSETLN